MKNLDIRPRVSKRKESKTDNINTLEDGVTKILLEKYISKGVSHIETMRDREAKRRVA